MPKAGYVAIVGRPNVGKSTLLNRLLKTKIAITSPKVQTTRHKILGILSGPGYQALFLDTPGLMEKARDELDQQMMARIGEALEEADLALLVADPAPPGEPENHLARSLQEKAKPALAVLNKMDSVPREKLKSVVAAYRDLQVFRDVLPVSALYSQKIDPLIAQIVRHLPESEPFYPEDQVTDLPERFIAAELIREKIYHVYGQEIPYDTAVEIEEFQEADPGEGRQKDLIRAVVYVNRESQKKILIGRGGEALKKVGAQARADIQDMLGRPVFLELWVKVRAKWRKDKAFLKRMGY